MHYEMSGKLSAPEREAGEAPCTPEQAVELARLCPGETFEKIRLLGTRQAAKMIAEGQRLKEQFNAEVRQAEEVAAQQAAKSTSRTALTWGALLGFFWPRR